METISRQVTLPTDVEEAWALLTDPVLTRDWLGAEVDLVPVVGTAGRVVDHDGTLRHLVVERVVEGERISWRWWTDDEPEPTRVEIEVVPVEEGAQVTVTEASAARGPRAQALASGAWAHRLLHLELVQLGAALIRR